MTRPADSITIDDLDSQERAKWSEKKFQAKVRREAEQQGWRIYAVWDSRKTPSGWPDLTLVRGKRLCFWELKSQKGKKPRPEQMEWLADLAEAGAETAWYRPSDWETIIRNLEEATV